MCYGRNNVIIFFYIVILCFIIQVTNTFKLENNNTRIRRQTNCGFRCNSKECIDAEKECDGIADCKDSSDETNACRRINCQSFLFRCKYGACINPEFKCDGKKDCADNSDETSEDCKKTSSTSGNCSPTEFQCDSGQCIDEDNKCDGKADCTDNSDETRALCSNINCPGFTYRCAYGACVNANAKCNGVKDCVDGSDENHPECGTITPVTPTTQPPTDTPVISQGSCILPPHPEKGKWIVWGSTQTYIPGDVVNAATVLTVECSKRYKVDGTTIILCKNGFWSSAMPQCIVLCPAVASTKITKVICRRNGAEVDCKEPTTGTIATYTCAPFYEDLQLRRNPNRYCLDGTWDNEKPSCAPACGIKSVSAQTLIIGGNTATKGDYPWQVAIYLDKKTDKELICGGSLLNQRVILTAAHCITDMKGVKKNKELYIVAVGKYYRNYSDQRETEAQFSTLKETFIPEQYKGDSQNYVSDIAILVTEKTFILSKRVLPVCVDWGGNYENYLLEPNSKGIVTGWGYTKQTGEPSEVLKEISVPYIDYNTCSREIPSDYEIYLTYDKLCSGYLNQSIGVCRGDSGGALVFKNKFDERYYVAGIVSVSPLADGSCDIQQYALYTKVSKYVTSFIIGIERSNRP